MSENKKLLRPICNHCKKDMQVVKVNSENETNFYFTCDCICEYSHNDDFDIEEVVN